ncbi:SDR family NAD(P)-dependent oxidoreductase [Actinokineospora sp. NPDC004072]
MTLATRRPTASVGVARHAVSGFPGHLGHWRASVPGVEKQPGGSLDGRCPLLELAAELGDRVLFVRLDVIDEDAWAAAAVEADHRFGPIAVLVNNRGRPEPRGTDRGHRAAVWRRILDVNLIGAFLGIKTATPSLRRNGGGVIVNIASTAAHVGTSLYAPYVASKWALRGLTRTAALELGRDGIRVNSVHPGVVSTPLINQPIAGQPPIADFYSPEPYAIPGSAPRPTSPRWSSTSPHPTPRSSQARDSSRTAALLLGPARRACGVTESADPARPRRLIDPP